MTNRKAKSLAPFKKGAPTIEKNSAVLLVERLLKRLLEAAIKMLKENPAEATRYFGHFFDVTVSEAERDQFVRAFLQAPPRVVLGYARSGVELPCYAIVMTSEEEAEAFLGDYVGHEDAFEYLGADFDATYTIYTYSMHADMTQVFYQLCKAIIHAGKGLLFQEGVISLSIGGGELAPDENYMPENMYVRQLRLNIKHPYTAPQLLPADPEKLRTLVFACDVNVDGMQGGVHFTTTLK
jgi:hypothetical protein